MREFGKIFKFELRGYLTNKVFVGVTIFLVVALALVMFFPMALEILSDGEEPAPEELPLMLIRGGDENVLAGFAAAFEDYRVEAAGDDVRERVLSGEAECAFELDGLSSYVYLVDNLSMYDNTASRAELLLREMYRADALEAAGLDSGTVDEIMGSVVTGSVESLGVDQGRNFLYTYIMIIALYMVIILYGQMVATNVATEKSSRAMELLITSARPVSMMFGKVTASCLAGFIQLGCTFGSALLFYNVNRSYWGDNGVMASIFDMPPLLFAYLLIFFVLGFLIYAFMFGAIGSTASKLEDINTSSMPVMLLFIAAFFVVVFSLSSGNIDTPLMRVCSFIPFTSPMAMFTRIAMTTVPLYEIIISIVILALSAAGVGVVAAKVYRVGVLMYGTPPKIGEIIKAIRRA